MRLLKLNPILSIAISSFRPSWSSPGIVESSCHDPLRVYSLCSSWDGLLETWITGYAHPPHTPFNAWTSCGHLWNKVQSLYPLSQLQKLAPIRFVKLISFLIPLFSISFNLTGRWLTGPLSMGFFLCPLLLSCCLLLDIWAQSKYYLHSLVSQDKVATQTRSIDSLGSICRYMIFCSHRYGHTVGMLLSATTKCKLKMWASVLIVCTFVSPVFGQCLTRSAQYLFVKWH